jgi:hypothetical protein
MTAHDKMSMMAEAGMPGQYKDSTPLFARGYSWWNEALHGL